MQQYLRNFSCVVAQDDGEGLELKDFKIQFQVRRGDMQTPNSADVRIFNLANSTANLLGQNEFTTIALKAGYGDDLALIFQGTVKQFRNGRIDQLDSYIDITAADGDEAYNFAPVLQSVPAGNNQSAVAKALLGTMSRFGVTQGYMPDFPSNQLIRGKVLNGLARDELRTFGISNECKWSLQDNALTFIPRTSYIAGGAIPVISVNNGLIGVPEQTQQGIFFRTLLNPRLKIGQLVQLTGGINTFRRSLDIPSQIQNEKTAQQVQTAADGLYYCMVVEHKGDTRGNEWYSEVTALSVDATITSDATLQALQAASAGSIKRYGQ